MEIKNILGKDKVTLSFEVFPPKQTSNSMEVEKAAYGVAELKPSYMSVTYGAGGSTRSNTLRIAQKIQDTYGITTIAHPQEKLGEMAAELILEKINGVSEAESKVERLIHPELIIRGSCRKAE